LIGVTPASAPKKRKQAILSFGRSGQLQVLRNTASPEKEIPPPPEIPFFYSGPPLCACQLRLIPPSVSQKTM